MAPKRMQTCRTSLEDLPADVFATILLRSGNVGAVLANRTTLSALPHFSGAKASDVAAPTSDDECEAREFRLKVRTRRRTKPEAVRALAASFAACASYMRHAYSEAAIRVLRVAAGRMSADQYRAVYEVLDEHPSSWTWKWTKVGDRLSERLRWAVTHGEPLDLEPIIRVVQTSSYHTGLWPLYDGLQEAVARCCMDRVRPFLAHVQLGRDIWCWRRRVNLIARAYEGPGGLAFAKALYHLRLGSWNSLRQVLEFAERKGDVDAVRWCKRTLMDAMDAEDNPIKQQKLSDNIDFAY